MRREGLASAWALACRLRLIAATIQLTRSLALAWISPTAWLSEALAQQGMSLTEFRARQAGKLHALSTGELASRLAASRALITVLRAVAQADGQTNAREWQAIRRCLYTMHLDEPALWAEVDPGKQICAAPTQSELVEAMSQLRDLLRPLDGALLLALIREVAEATGGVDAEERKAAFMMGEFFGIDASETESWMGQDPRKDARAEDSRKRAQQGAERATPRRSAAEVLGVAAHANAREVRRAYLKLAMKHHPDRVAHLGPAMMQAANQRMKEINAAYEELRASKSRSSS